MIAVTASGGQNGKLNKLRGAGYVKKCDHPTVTEGAWPAEALAITEAGRAVLAAYRAEIANKKGRRRSDKRVIFRRDGERYIVFIGNDDRIGFVRRADDGSWNYVDTTMAHSGYANNKTRERAGQLLRRRYERMVREGSGDADRRFGQRDHTVGRKYSIRPSSDALLSQAEAGRERSSVWPDFNTLFRQATDITALLAKFWRPWARRNRSSTRTRSR
jgi:hypothetical protein